VGAGVCPPLPPDLGVGLAPPLSSSPRPPLPPPLPAGLPLSIGVLGAGDLPWS
jgi:hypothetical protein